MSDSDDRLDLLDYYTLIGVARDADHDAIKRAFRTFARRFHPDRFIGAPPDKVERATRIYRRGSEAVQTLTDVDGRHAYDLALSKGELRLKSDARAARAQVAAPPQARTTQGAAPRAAPTPYAQHQGAGQHGAGRAPAGQPSAHVAPHRAPQAASGGRLPDAPAQRAAAPRTIQSPSARAYFTKAQESSRAGDLKTALRHVRSAMEQEPGNPILEQALSKIESAIRGW